MAVGPIGFHRVRGENIRVTNNGRTATREESFNKALCFTDRALKANEKLTFRIAQVSRAWSGTLRVGVTVHDPETFDGNLPKYCCPDLNMKPGNWGKAVDEAHAVENTMLQVYYTPQGNVMLKVNANEPETFLTGVRCGVPLYVLFDVYGNTQGIELVGVSLRNAQPAPTAAQPAVIAPGTAAGPRLNNASIRSESFKNIDLRAAQLAIVNTAHVQSSATVANGLTGKPGGVAMTETALRGGQAMIFTLRELHRSLPIDIALSSATAAEIRAFTSLEDLCDQTYSVPFKSGIATPGEEFAVVISEQGVVHVSHAGKKWLQCVHVDPQVQFRVVFDMQSVKKLSVVGTTTQLQAPTGAATGSADASGRGTSNAGGSRGTERSSTDCVICLENPRDTLLRPCAHFVLCSSCVRSLLASPQKECPMCRKTIEDSQRIYMN